MIISFDNDVISFIQGKTMCVSIVLNDELVRKEYDRIGFVDVWTTIGSFVVPVSHVV